MSIDLTAREIEVLDLVAQGFTNATIARRLACSPETIKSHIRRVRQKLGAANRTHAVVLAQMLGHCSRRHEHRPVRCPFCDRRFHVQISSETA